jgi:hypothetical protein
VVASIAPGGPVRPSQQTFGTETSRLARSAHTDTQNFRALTGLKPDPQDAPDAVRVDPDGVCAALLPTLAPSRTLTTIPVGGDHRGHRVQRAGRLEGELGADPLVARR